PTLSNHYYFKSSDLWLSYSQGFRNPTLTDLFSNSPSFVGNPDLEAETSEQFEVGIKSKQPHKLSWDFRLFHMEYKNFVESTEISPSVFSRTNRGSGYSRGLDAEIAWTAPLVKASLAYNYLDTKSRQLSRSFRLSPRHQLTLNAWHNFGHFDLQIQNTHWYRVIDVNLNQAVELEDWQQWNFFISRQLFQKTHLQIGLINAFNEGKQLTINYPEPQRKYWVQVRQRF
ncbi:MAG: TonB-dependent receptor, partial [Pseudomonadota bacterium]